MKSVLPAVLRPLPAAARAAGSAYAALTGRPDVVTSGLLGREEDVVRLSSPDEPPNKQEKFNAIDGTEHTDDTKKRT